ncbi:hypothetical protein Pla52o_53400 [Novipirellula galeiformis]|uniref:Uncharacterized protein n=1 Tax=Novipirellula galeiformis TaxID=2528004 RepID=A0A5C6C283_9BACT|nr:hypothetical protein Pla52o_53400 [Novipirellula galeiformis]
MSSVHATGGEVGYTGEAHDHDVMVCHAFFQQPAAACDGDGTAVLFYPVPFPV